MKHCDKSRTMMNSTNKQTINGKLRLAFHERNLRISILSLLRHEGGMPRALLSEKLQTTPAMMTRGIQRLLVEGLVHEEGRSKGSGGRMCTNVTPNPNAGVLIGIEYNQQEINTVAINFASHLEKQLSFPVPEKAQTGAAEKLIPALFEAIHETFNSVAKLQPLLGIAAVDPGIIDTLTGMTISSNLLPKWKQVPIRQKLSTEFNVPVYLSNTTNAILAAVDRHELARRYADILYLEYRNGVSCAIKSHGNPILGARGMAGELTSVSSGSRDNNRPVYIEKTLGFSGIRQRLNKEGHPAFQTAIPRTDMIEKILTLASKNDPLVTRVLEETWYQLGQVFGNLANLMNPEAIVLDPHFGKAGNTSLAALKQGMKTQMITSHADQVEIIISELEEPVASIGAALTLLDDLTFNYEFV